MHAGSVWLEDDHDEAEPGQADGGMPLTVQAALLRVLWEAVHTRRRTLYGRRCKDMASFFAAVDKDQTGTITRHELREAMVRLDVGLSPVQLDRLVRTIDTDRSGGIEYSELESWMNKRGGAADRGSTNSTGKHVRNRSASKPLATTREPTTSSTWR